MSGKSFFTALTSPVGYKVKDTKKAKKMATAPEVESFGNIKFTLNNGFEMPAVGIGTFRIRKGDDIMRVVDSALAAGYRLFAPSDHGGPDFVQRAYKKSLDNLGFDYVDLCLVHCTGTSRINGSDPRYQKIRRATWACLEELYDNGLVNAIGVSNFTIRHLDEIAKNHSVMPTVNQVEWHPFYHQPELLNYCKGKDIVVQAYCSFGGTSTSNPDLLEHPVVKKIANKLEVTCAQVLLVWALQQDVAVIPKSTNPERIKENITLNFRIPDEDMKLLNALGEKKYKVCLAS